MPLIVTVNNQEHELENVNGSYTLGLNNLNPNTTYQVSYTPKVNKTVTLQFKTPGPEFTFVAVSC